MAEQKFKNRRPVALPEEQPIPQPKSPTEEPSVPTVQPHFISFDAYFENMMRKSAGKIQPHHKIPMEQFLQRFGNTDVQTVEWFDQHIKLY